MSLRIWLVLLIVAATAAFVVGTTIERHNAHSKTARATSTSGSGETTPATSGEAGGGESAAHRQAEGKGTNAAPETHSELKPLGINIEAVPFVVLAALTSLALATAAWLRPRSVPLLIVIALIMLGFGVLDLREISHQNDEGKSGLAALAALVAALHFAAALLAVLMARASRNAASEETGGAATISA